MLAWLITSLYVKSFECKICPICKPATKIHEALVHSPPHPSPLPMFRFDFKVTSLKQHCKKGGKTTWSKNTSASRFLNEFMGLRYMYLVRSYFALSSLHLLRNSPLSFTHKVVRIIYCESRVRAVSSLCLFMPPSTDKWRKPKTWPHVCLPMFGQEVGLKREVKGVSGKIEGWGWKGNGRGRGRNVG